MVQTVFRLLQMTLEFSNVYFSQQFFAYLESTDA